MVSFACVETMITKTGNIVLIGRVAAVFVKYANYSKRKVASRCSASNAEEDQLIRPNSDGAMSTHL
jgi:hypothetical protein